MQETYGLDIDSIGIDHSVDQYAACAAQLPPTARVFVAENEDRIWGLNESLLAAIANGINTLCWIVGNIGAKKGRRSKRPKMIGPGMQKSDASEQKVKAKVLPIDELKEILSRPRKEVKNG